MTIGVKYYAKGGGVPALFANLSFIKFFMRYDWEVFNAETAVDGVKSSELRKYLHVSCEFHNVWDAATTVLYSDSSSTSLTISAYIHAMLSSYYVRFSDSRHTGTDAIAFIRNGAPEVTRDGESEVLKTIRMNYISESPI